MARPQVLFVDRTFPDASIERAVIADAGADLIDPQLRGNELPEEWLVRLPEFDVVLCQHMRFGVRELDRLTRCRTLVRTGVGFDVIDVPAATARGIVVANVPDYGTEEVATHAFALLLAAARRLDIFMAGVRRGEWGVARARPLHRLVGQTLGVVGYGRIGRAVARRAPGFGLQVIACDPYAPPDDTGVPRVALRDLLARSDFVTLHVPLTAQTRHMIDAEALAAMRPEAVLVNTSRGPVVDPAALAEALAAGAIACAACDVHEQEPLPVDHALLALPNFLPTPHAAWYTEESMADMRRLAADEAVRGVRGQPPRSWVNPEAGLGRLQRPWAP